MIFAALVALLMSTGLSLITYAQQAGPNVNVLPVVLPTNSTPYADAALLGDLYLNRQVEPALAVSTRNPAHMLAFFNDYRAVDIPDDPALGEQSAGTLTLAWNYVQKFFARVIGKPSRKGNIQLPPFAAAGEAWVGGSRSYDGGQTWSGMFLPGAPFDGSDASIASPVHGLAAATDPVLAAGPCGMFYLGFLAFDRGGASKMAIAAYQDLNNEQGGDTIVYKGTKILESANNANFGYFLDKPAIGVDPARSAGTDPCAHNVYVSYTTFNGQSKDGKAQTKITVARSINSGQTFSVTKLNQPFQQAQGTAIAIDPRDGTPQSTGGGTLYVAFRHFNDPDTILVHKSTNFGQTFSGQPVNLLSGSTTPTLQKYDQPTIPTSTPDPKHELMFRSLAFPTITVTGDGTVMVAWTERVDFDPATATFKPSATGTPRIVLMRSRNGGNTWTDINGNANARIAVDVGKRDTATPPPQPVGYLFQQRDSGPQIQPYLSFGAGKLMMLYYESRGLMTRPPDKETIFPVDVTPTPNGMYAAGFDRLFDVRAALLDPLTGSLLSPATTAQVSRYTLKTSADFSDGETLDDVLAVNSPCSPDDPNGTVPCERRVDRANKPTSKSGTSPFKGDYLGLTPAVTMVPKANGTGWRWAVNPSDVPARVFHGIFADNRNLVPPTVPDGPEWFRYATYTPPFKAECAVNGGSRNTDVFVSRIDGDLVLTTPTSFTQLQNIQRTFPIVVSNGAASPRYFRLSFATQADEAIASFRQESNLEQDDVFVDPYSSSTRVVYIGDCSSGKCLAPATARPVTVRVQQTDANGNAIPGGASGTVTLNADASNPPVINIDNAELHNPEIGAPEIGAPEIGAPEIGAPEIGAPEIGAPEIGATAPGDYVKVQDTTWTLTNTGNTASAYTANVHIDHPEQYKDDYRFQLIIHKAGGFGTLTNCVSASKPQSQIISIIANPEIGAPEIGAPEIGAPEIGAATFAMGPSDSPASSRVSGLAARTQPGTETLVAVVPTNDGTLKAAKASENVKITLRAYQLTPNPKVIFNPKVSLPAVAIAQQSKDNNNGVLSPLGVAVQGADLTVSGTPTVTSTTVQAGATVPVGPWTIQNVGNLDAIPVEDQNGDGKINNSLYLSPTDPYDPRRFNPNLPNFNPGDIRIGSAGDIVAVTKGSSAVVGASSGIIPPDTTPGNYFLFIVADDGSQFVTGEVNELNENNNASLPITVTVTAPNAAPIATAQSVTTDEDTPQAITLTGTDDNNDNLTFAIVGQPAHGTLSGSGANQTYTPALNYNGKDSFTFKANDGALDSKEAIVSITVRPVNDAPVANAQSKNVVENTATAIVLTGSDVEGSALTYALVSQPTHGTLSGSAPNVTYTPQLNYIGPDSFTFRVNDGALNSSTATVSITVTQGIDQYGFNGLLSSYAPPPKSGNLGSSQPVVWQYTLGGAVVNTAAEMPRVTFTKMNATNNTCTSPAGDMTPVPNSTYFENSDFPGNSSFQYNASTNTWQFNWQTGPPVSAGCWSIRVILQRTGQVNGPFPLKLGK